MLASERSVVILVRCKLGRIDCWTALPAAQPQHRTRRLDPRHGIAIFMLARFVCYLMKIILFFVEAHDATIASPA
ncbi:MAG: hypothetical protein AB7U73_24760, partial [Pirellulales bacterium]